MEYRPKYDVNSQTIHMDSLSLKLKDCHDIVLITIDPCVINHKIKQNIRYWGKCSVISKDHENPMFSIEEYSPCAQNYEEWYKQRKGLSAKQCDWKQESYWNVLKPQKAKYNLYDLFNMLPKEKITYLTEFRELIPNGVYIYSKNKIKIS